MHILIVFVEFSRVSLRGKPCKTLFVDIDSERLIASNDNINSQIKFVPVDQKWIGYISGNNRKFINI